jgi:radical SAM-linked protein
MSCSDCNGCDPGLRLKRKFATPRRTVPRREPEFGKKTDQPLRYEIVYAKAGTARYLSHRDLTNHLQRAFRRAGIETAFSGGFHPKMIFSYAPALALGMEGKAEILEFRAARDFEPGRFIRRLNRFVRSGIRVSGLRSLGDTVPPLSRRITGTLFSISLGDREVSEALERRKSERGAVGQDDRSFLEKEMVAALSGAQEPPVRFWVDRRRRRLLLSLPQRSGGGPRPQDIVAAVFGLAHPSFYLTREGFIFAGGESRQDPPPSRK